LTYILCKCAVLFLGDIKSSKL